MLAQLGCGFFSYERACIGDDIAVAAGQGHVAQQQGVLLSNGGTSVYRVIVPFQHSTELGQWQYLARDGRSLY